MIAISFVIKLSICFLTGNVYFDVRSWGNKYGKLTSIYPNAQEETGMLTFLTGFIVVLLVSSTFQETFDLSLA